MSTREKVVIFCSFLTPDRYPQSSEKQEGDAWLARVNSKSDWKLTRGSISLPSALVLSCLLRRENISIEIRKRGFGFHSCMLLWFYKYIHYGKQ